MHRAFRRGVFASSFLGIAGLLLVVACSSDQGADPGAQLAPLQPGAASARKPAKVEIASLLGRATVQLSSRGSVLVPVQRDKPSAGELTPKLDMELPIVAGGALRLRPTTSLEHSLVLTPVAASNAQAELASDGSAVYERAFGSADLVQSATLDGLRSQLAIRDARSPDLFAWKSELGAGLRAVPRDDLGTDFADEKGNVWLSVSPVSIVDGLGHSSAAHLHFDSDGFARLRVDHRNLDYPALVDFAVTLGNIQALAIAPTTIKGRVMVLLDTSGSMLYEFGSNTGTLGDSPNDGSAVLCDNALGGTPASTFACNANLPCTIANGGRPYFPVTSDANPSRMLASKLALQNVVNANAGILDFGLERYVEDAACPNTTNPAYCCVSPIDGVTKGRCMDHDGYTDIPNSGGANDLTYAGSCGTPARGGRVLVSPGASSSTQLLPWVDFVEDFCSSTAVAGAAPRNPELRGSGNTPLGRAVTTAREDWYKPVFTDSRTAGAQALDDTLIDCRPYVLVVMTDGDDTCNAGDPAYNFDCAATNGSCGSGRCFDSNTGNNTDWRCACNANAQCTGAEQVCTLGASTQDCGGTNAQCGSGACIDTSGGGDNWRCACTVTADCGTGMVCATGTNPIVDCRNDNARCVAGSNCYNGGGGNYRCSCNADAQCAATQRCDVANNRCVARGVCQASGVCQVAEPLPRVQVQRMTDINVTNPVKTYVLGMGDPATLNQTELNAMALNGGSGTARFATSQTEIEAAFADIVANTVKYEKCNALDDNCNDRYDEGLGVYQECLTALDCNGGTCDHGRCVCNGNAQCGAGYTCSAETPTRFCRPSCSEGQGACLVPGVRKCGVGVGQCCKNDASATCNDIVPPVGSPETCNGLDDNCNGFIDENLSCQGCVPLPEVCDGKDNDCDGKIDETGAGGLVDIGGPCGSSVGRCTPGTAVCANGTLGCSGDTGPFPEVCNGYDDDCDGVVDGMNQACYTGPALTQDVGTCRGGTQLCAVTTLGVEKWGTCTGQQLPTTEICNGLDDDCDGVIDNGIPAPTPGQVTGGECCSDKANGSKCGQGQCSRGMWVCAGSVVVCANAGSPTNETCDNIDNDCDGTVDNIITVGGPCVAPGGCSGTLKCDSDQKQLVCQPDGSAHVEVCDGIDNDCDGKTDEIEDVSVNDDWWGDACDAPPEGHDHPPCAAGKYVCKNGAKACEGAVGPLPEVCDLKDTDCDGVADTLAACPGTNACVQGVCVEPCHGGEFPCPGGYDCQSFDGKKYCVPTTCNAVECPPGASCMNGKCTLDNVGGAGNAAGAGNGNEAGDTSASASGAGAVAEGGDNAAAGNGSGATGKGGSSNATAGNGHATPGTEAHGAFGLVTGGGGCACRAAPLGNGKWAGLASLLVLGSALGRRRRGAAKRRAA